MFSFNLIFISCTSNIQLFFLYLMSLKKWKKSSLFLIIWVWKTTTTALQTFTFPQSHTHTHTRERTAGVLPEYLNFCYTKILSCSCAVTKTKEKTKNLLFSQICSIFPNQLADCELSQKRGVCVMWRQETFLPTISIMPPHFGITKSYFEQNIHHGHSFVFKKRFCVCTISPSFRRLNWEANVV